MSCEIIDKVLTHAIDYATPVLVYDGKNQLTGVIKGGLLNFPILVLNDGREFEFSKTALYRALTEQVILHV